MTATDKATIIQDRDNDPSISYFDSSPHFCDSRRDLIPVSQYGVRRAPPSAYIPFAVRSSADRHGTVTLDAMRLYRSSFFYHAYPALSSDFEKTVIINDKNPLTNIASG